MRIQCLQHVPFEGPAAIADWARQRGHAIGISRLYEAAEPPSQDGFDWLVVMGGPMGIHDEAEHPWLKREKAFLRESIDAGKTVVGVCLGAQLLAGVLGARVHRGPQKEIGWFPVELTDAACESGLLDGLPERFEVFHWHGDTFDLPTGALHLASSEACVNQAFLYDGRVLGLQFHVESTPASVRDIIRHCGDEIVPAPYIQSAERMLSAAGGEFDNINRVLFQVLDRLSD
jgi:GMP synthase-like glutamine amidotransferase